MKLFTPIIVALFSTILIISCESSKSAQAKNENSISKLTLDKITRGSNSQLVITKNETMHSEMLLGNGSDASKGETDQKDWDKINQLVSKLDLNKLNLWEAPTQARFHDGAMATTISIEANGETYNSQSFDEGQPPPELKELYDYLESLVNQ